MNFKKNVGLISLYLKILRFSHELMSSGSLFQSSGTATENALDP